MGEYILLIVLNNLLILYTKVVCILEKKSPVQYKENIIIDKKCILL